jgi:hypothetical protein
MTSFMNLIFEVRKLPDFSNLKVQTDSIGLFSGFDNSLNLSSRLLV